MIYIYIYVHVSHSFCISRIQASNAWSLLLLGSKTTISIQFLLISGNLPRAWRGEREWPIKSNWNLDDHGDLWLIYDLDPETPIRLQQVSINSMLDIVGSLLTFSRDSFSTERCSVAESYGHSHSSPSLGGSSRLSHQIAKSDAMRRNLLNLNSHEITSGSQGMGSPTENILNLFLFV